MLFDGILYVVVGPLKMSFLTVKKEPKNTEKRGEKRVVKEKSLEEFIY